MPKLKHDYRCSPDGVTVYRFRKGEEVTGVVAEMAERAGAIDKRSVRPKPAPVENKVITPAENKADDSEAE